MKLKTDTLNKAIKPQAHKAECSHILSVTAGARDDCTHV